MSLDPPPQVDVHFVKGDLRIAHCGNRRVDSDLVDSLLSLIEGFAGLAGRKFLYDTSQIGCFPSLSSVPADEQRLFRDLMGEVRAWADRPENSGEFLVIYLDSTDLLTQWVSGERCGVTHRFSMQHVCLSSSCNTRSLC